MKQESMIYEQKKHTSYKMDGFASWESLSQSDSEIWSSLKHI